VSFVGGDEEKTREEGGGYRKEDGNKTFGLVIPPKQAKIFLSIVDQS
jgi:hypothetical protein